MNISKQEAQQSLEEIHDVITRTRAAIAHGPASVMLIMWGVIWVIGYSCTQFWPGVSGVAWALLVSGGVIASIVVGVRRGEGAKSRGDARFGIFWMVLFGYAALWMLLLHPTHLPSGVEWANSQRMNDRQIGAFYATVPMFAYVVGGMWLSRFFVWLGLIVTALTIAGFYLLPNWFSLWMALMGGGSLIVAGLFIRANWR